jgi:hypothetical protein
VLQRGPNLNLDRLPGDHGDDVYRSVAVTWIVAAVYYGRSGEVGFYGRNEILLLHSIRYDDPAPRDILHLAQSDALATEFLHYRARGLGQPSCRELTALTDRLDYRLVRLAKRPSVIFEQSKIVFGVGTFL